MTSSAPTDKTPALKDAHRWQLFLILAGNVVAFSAIVTYGELRLSDIESVADDWKRLWICVGSLAAAAVIVTVMNGLLSSRAKARLVFWRWRDPMPGCRAFSRHLRDDPRIDFATLERTLGPLPSKPHAQNSLWYRLYQRVEMDPMIRSVHRDFLLCRDYAAASFLILFVFGCTATLVMATNKTRWIYGAFLVLQYLAAAWAARNYGNRLVTSAVAVWQKGAPTDDRTREAVSP